MLAVRIAIAVLVVLFVAGLVFATVLTSLYQLDYERIQESEASGSGQAPDP